MKLTLIVLSAVILLQGCAAAVVVPIAISETDRMVNSTTQRPNLTDSVQVEKYQFVPDAAAMNKLCQAALEQKVGKFDVKDMKVSHSRNYITGVSTCTASLYAEPMKGSTVRTEQKSSSALAPGQNYNDYEARMGAYKSLSK